MLALPVCLVVHQCSVTWGGASTVYVGVRLVGAGEGEGSSYSELILKRSTCREGDAEDAEGDAVPAARLAGP